MLAKNLLLPGVILAAMIVVGVAQPERALTAITLAIPSASIPVIFAVQYKIAEKEMSSTLFFSTLLSVPTMGLFIFFTGS